MKGYLEESIEWTSTWREATEDDTTPRILLIGDSISVGYRDFLEKKLQGRYHITCLGTSKTVDNPYLIEEVRLLAAQDPMRHSVVLVNNGGHGVHLSREEFAYDYETFLRELKKLEPDARFVMITLTHVKDERDLTKFGQRNAQVLERNEVALELAEKLHMEILDLYPVGLANQHLQREDGDHFTPAGYEVLAQAVADAILK